MAAGAVQAPAINGGLSFRILEEDKTIKVFQLEHFFRDMAMNCVDVLTDHCFC